MLERLISDLAHIYTRLRIEWRRSELALGRGLLLARCIIRGFCLAHSLVLVCQAE